MVVEATKSQEKVFYHHTKPQKGIKRTTYAGIYNNDELYIGISSCSLKDQFIKEKGRKIAEGRARKKNCLYSEKLVMNENPGKRFMEIIKSGVIKID